MDPAPTEDKHTRNIMYMIPEDLTAIHLDLCMILYIPTVDSPLSLLYSAQKKKTVLKCIPMQLNKHSVGPWPSKASTVRMCPRFETQKYSNGQLNIYICIPYLYYLTCKSLFENCLKWYLPPSKHFMITGLYKAFWEEGCKKQKKIVVSKRGSAVLQLTS